MKRREHRIGTGEQKLRCPACGARIHRDFGSPQCRPLVSQSGHLTKCDHCFSWLEYVLQDRHLALRPACQRRIDEFSRAAKETHRFSLTELVDYVTRHRRMPVNSSPTLRQSMRLEKRGLGDLSGIRKESDQNISARNAYTGQTTEMELEVSKRQPSKKPS